MPPPSDGYGWGLRWERKFGGIGLALGLRTLTLTPAPKPETEASRLPLMLGPGEASQPDPVDSEALRVWESEGGRSA